MLMKKCGRFYWNILQDYVLLNREKTFVSQFSNFFLFLGTCGLLGQVWKSQGNAWSSQWGWGHHHWWNHGQDQDMVGRTDHSLKRLFFSAQMYNQNQFRFTSKRIMAHQNC